MTKRSKRAEAGVIQNGPGGSQEYPKHSKQNAVIRSAAAAARGLDLASK